MLCNEDMNFDAKEMNRKTKATKKKTESRIFNNYKLKLEREYKTVGECFTDRDVYKAINTRGQGLKENADKGLHGSRYQEKMGANKKAITSRR